MSSASVSDFFVEEAAIRELFRIHTSLALFLQSPVTVDYSHDIPYVSGISWDGDVVYIDRNYPFGKEDSKFLTVRERTEWWLMKVLKWEYNRAGRWSGALMKLVVEAANKNWVAFARRLDEYIATTDWHKPLTIPRSLILHPYRHNVKLLAHLRNMQAERRRQDARNRRKDFVQSDGEAG